ncbi:archaea-specific SMC-related protein [Haladaptatus sp. ZSTT2]|uniref:archaea-specific SMC-related protein n=1 Tax=Haladaptatus sp. ZSTT2 TaxID=3120515 RepID=UPI00300F0193
MTWKLTITNIAGIRTGKATIEPGINAVRGSNWQGKSSLLTAIETAMGTETVLTEGETSGDVTLETKEKTARVDLTRENGTVVSQGTPYLTTEQQQTAARLYAFLDEDNAVRQAVRNGENMEAVLMRPLDFENIDEQIATLKAERNQVEAELERAESASNKLPQVEQQIASIEDELDSLRRKRSDLGDGQTEGDDGKRDELANAKAERDRVENQIDRLERTVERTEEKLAEIREQRDELTIPETPDDLEAELETHREQYEQRRRDAELLQSVYAPTKRILDENRLDLITEVTHELAADSATCWTCGTDATRAAFDEHVDKLQSRVASLWEAANEHEAQFNELQSRKEELREAQQRVADLEDQRADLERRLEERTASLKTAESRLTELESNIESLSEAVKEDDDKLADVDGEIKYAEARLEDAREQRETLETQAQQKDTLQAECDRIDEEIVSLRTRKEALKQRTREAFEAAMQELIPRFAVGFETARLTSTFDLVVARDGREASLDALSEGEVELLGLVAALAGYEAFDVADTVPIMLVDNLGGLADENLQTLVEYLESRATYLVVTTYPEHSSFEGHTINPGEWTVVSPQSP